MYVGLDTKEGTPPNLRLPSFISVLLKFFFIFFGGRLKTALEYISDDIFAENLQIRVHDFIQPKIRQKRSLYNKYIIINI